MFLPDTNIFILGLRGSEPEASFLRKAIEKKRLCISVVVIGEFLSKVREQDIEPFDRLVGIFKVVPVDQEVARIGAKMRRESLKTKRTYLADCFLAAQAKAHKLILVTNNKSDFPMKDIKIILP